jgi:hypothetical protein
MARSLTVSHDESTSVNWLFAGFLLIAIGWTTMAGVASMLTASGELDGAERTDVALQPISR